MDLFSRVASAPTSREARGLRGVARGVVLALMSTIVALWVLAPAWRARPARPNLDGEFVLQQIEIGKASIRYYGEFPLWNAYDCHGIPMWDHPEGMVASPLLLLMTPLDGMTTYFLWDFFHVAAGFAAMWWFLRREMNVTRLAAFAGAALWAGSPALASQTLARHSTMLDLYLAPLVLYLWRRAAASVPHAVGLGLLFVFLLLEGATYPIPMFGLMLALDALTRLSSVREAVKIARGGAVFGLVFATVGAARWIPLADQMTQWKRALVTEPATPVLVLARAYVEKITVTPKAPMHLWEWHEYQAYLGPALVAFAFVGALLLPRGKRGFLLVVAVMAVLMLGSFHAYAPAALLKRVPLFSSMRVEPRYRHLVTMYLCAFIAIALDRLPELVRRFAPTWGARVRAGSALLVLASVGAAAGFTGDQLKERFKAAPADVRPPSPRLYYGGPGISANLQDPPAHNRMWMGCRSYEWKNSTFSPVWEGDVPQVRVGAGDAEILTSRRTANTFRARVRARTPARIVLNSGHERSFRTNVGVIALEGEHKGSGGGALLAVDLPPGEHDVVVRYWPRRLTLGLVVSALGILGLAAAAYVHRRRARRAATRSGGAASGGSGPGEGAAPVADALPPP